MQILNIESRNRQCRRAAPVLKRLRLGEFIIQFQRALLNIELLGSGIGAVLISSFLLAGSVFHQGDAYRPREASDLKTTIPLRERVSRFLSERYRHRERPGFFADLFLWALIVLIAAWPVALLAQAMERMK